MKHLLLPLFAFLFSQSITASEKPNVLLILADDLGWSDTTLSNRLVPSTLPLGISGTSNDPHFKDVVSFFLQ